MRIECPNYLMKEKTKNSKDKWLVATWTFAAITDKVIMENASDSGDSSDDEVPKKLTLQEAYDKLCTEFIKSEKTSHLCRKALNEVKLKKLIC